MLFWQAIFIRLWFRSVDIIRFSSASVFPTNVSCQLLGQGMYRECEMIVGGEAVVADRLTFSIVAGKISSNDLQIDHTSYKLLRAIGLSENQDLKLRFFLIWVGIKPTIMHTIT